MVECPLCIIPKNEKVIYEDSLIYLVETKEKRGHQVRAMVCTKRHSSEPTFEEQTLSYACLIDYMKHNLRDECWFLVGMSKYTSFPAHFHIMACDNKSEDLEELEKLHNTPRVFMPYGISFQTKINKVLIGIPAYNEEKTVGEIVVQARKYGDVIVVDDGSTDSTCEQSSLAGAHVIKNDRNCGVGYSTARIFKEAKDKGYETLVTLDADGQHCPDEIPKFVDAIKNGVDVAMGNRFLNSKIPVYREIGIRTISKPLGVEDAQCCFRGYNRKAIETLDLKETGMGFSLEIIQQAKEKDFKITEVPCTVRYFEKAKRNPFRHGASLIETLLWSTIWKNPLLYLGLPSFLLLSFGLFSTVMLIYTYTVGHWFTISWAILGLGGLLSGALLGMASLIIWSIKRGLAK